MTAAAYQRIVAHYESCLARHGDSHRGVDWPSAQDADKRYAVMLGVVRPGGPAPARLLDFGCGAGHLYEYMRRRGVSGIDYRGLDLSERFTALCRAKFPSVPFHCVDVLEHAGPLPAVDYIVANGVFTEKRDLAHADMFDYFRAVLRRLFPLATTGMAFNVMSKQVDWERDDLFHLPCDELARFLKRELSRHFVLRHDYGLYEYTAYVYREECAWPA